MGYVNADNSYLISLLSDMSMVAGYIREGDSFCGGACGSLNASGELGAQLKQFLDIDKNQAVPVAEQIDRLRSYVSRYMEEISNVDRGITSEFDHIASEQEVDVHYSSVDSILRNDKITQYGKILLLLGIFGPVLGPILWTIYKQREKVHINDDHHTTTTPPPTQEEEKEQTEPEEKPVEVNDGKLKKYVGSGECHGDYSDYNVVQCYDKSYIFKQGDYFKELTAQKGKNSGCTCSSEAMLWNMKHPEGPHITPEDCNGYGDKRTFNCNWKYSHPIPNSANGTEYSSVHVTAQDQRNLCAQYVNDGTPVHIRLGGHSVVAIGIREGADPNNIQPSDILCIDPFYGDVRLMSECSNSSSGNNTYWDLDIANDVKE